MPKWLIWVIAGVFGSCLLCGGTCGLLAYRGYGEYTTASNEATASADKIVVPILKTWDSKALINHGTKQLVAENSAEKFEGIMKTLDEMFGEYQSIGAWATEGVSAKTDTSGSYASVRLKATGSFKKQSGIVRVELRRETGSEEWRINSFYVNEPSADPK